MRRSYQITGITLKGSSFGEADRLLTILSPEMGLIRAVAPGARNPKSALRGRCEIFSINEYWLNQGRSLARITQIQTLDSYPALGKDVGKLTAGQYLSEVALCLALTEQPQQDLYSLLNEHLRRIAALTATDSLHAHLTQALFHLLALGGFAPAVHYCSVSQKTILVNFEDLRWQIGFSFEQGGLVYLSDITSSRPIPKDHPHAVIPIQRKVNAIEVTLLQHLSQATLPVLAEVLPLPVLKSFREGHWVRLERVLRDYAQFHLGQSFRSAALLDSLTTLEF